MGANAQTTVPTFTASQVLTAQQMNDSARTGVPVFADATARNAGFGGSGEKTLAEGQLAYLEDLNVVQYYDGAVWATVGPAAAGALTLISVTTIGSAVSSHAVSNVFSSTYDNYMITVSGGVASVLDRDLSLQLGATTTGYYAGASGVTYSTSAASLSADNNSASWTKAGSGTQNSLAMCLNLIGPNLAKFTYFHSMYVAADTSRMARQVSGFLNNSTQYTGFTLIIQTGTMTGGEVRVYGYANS